MGNQADGCPGYRFMRHLQGCGGAGLLGTTEEKG